LHKVERVFRRASLISESAAVLWDRSKSRPLALGEFALAIVILAFACSMPILLFPAVVVLLIAFLDRLGLTLPGKIVVLLILCGIAWLVLIHPVGLHWLGLR
jgi:hypothetical protein